MLSSPDINSTEDLQLKHQQSHMMQTAAACAQLPPYEFYPPPPHQHQTPTLQATITNPHSPQNFWNTTGNIFQTVVFLYLLEASESEW